MPARPSGDDSFSFFSFLLTLLKMVTIILFPLIFCATCSTKNVCHILEIAPLYVHFKTFSTDMKLAFPVVSALFIILVILSKIPLGKLVSGFTSKRLANSDKKYRLNGFYQLLICLASFGGICYYGFDVGLGFRKSKAIVFAALIHSIFWSIFIYLYAKFKKDESRSVHTHRAKFLGNFYYGQDSNPWLFGFEDLKTRFLHFGLIGLVLWDLSIMSKPFLTTGTIPIPLILATSMHLLFVSVYFLREENMLSTCTYRVDGVGFAYLAGIGYALPSLFALQSLYLVKYSEKTIVLPHWCSGAIAILFLIGLYIHDSSMALKHCFRQNAFAPNMNYVKSIPSSLKRRLITSGLWGKIRHPNYLGFLLMVIACTLPCGFTHLVPYLPLLFCIVLVGFRMLRMESTCSKAYGPAWQNYKEIAKYRIIPFVY